MRNLALFLLCVPAFTVHAAELNNSERYELLLARVKADESTKSKNEIAWMYSLKWAHDCMRQYREAEEVSNKLIEHLGKKADLLFDKSCYVGKQGRFDEALKLAEEGLTLKADDLRGRMVKGIWLAALGRKDDVAALLKTIQPPKTTEQNHNLYWLCKSYVMARLNDETAAKEAIQECLRSDVDHWGYDCFQRDVTFDPFREKQWFIELVGKTIKE